MDGLDTPPPSELERPRLGAPPPSALQPRALFFAALFAACVSLLLRPLWSAASGDPDPGKRDFSAAFEAAHLAKFSIGLAALKSRFSSAKPAEEIDPIRAELASSALKADSPRAIAVHLILDDYLQIDETERDLARRWGALPPPANQAETRERALITKICVDEKPVPSGDAAWLAGRLGFAGTLAEALNQELGDSDPSGEARKRIDSVSLGYVLKFLGLIFAGGMGALIGLVLLAVFVGMGFSGELGRGFRPSILPPAIHFEAFTLYLAYMAALQFVMSRLRFHSLALSIVLEILILGLALYPLLWGARLSDLRADLGLTRGRGFFAELAAGPLGYLGFLPAMIASVIVVAIVLVKMLGFELSSGMHPIVPLLAGPGSSPLLKIAVVFLAVVLAPLIEETMFRGYFYRALRARFSAPAAVILSALLFAAVHPQGVIGIPLLFPIGAMLAILREWRGSLIAPMIAHACVNGATLALLSVML